MRLSRGNFTTNRERVSNEILSQQILLQSGQLKRYATGIYGKNNLLVKAQANIENVIREVLEKYDCIEIVLPLLQPKSLWVESQRWDNYNASGQMFYCDMPNGTFCMAPTAEEAVLAFVKGNVTSYKQLPINVYQIGTKFRNELRSRGGLLRSKEFTMMDAYTFHESQEDLAREYANMRKAYLEIFDRLCLKVIPVKALSGDIGGNYSEEFMCIANSGEDTILVNDDFSMAFNAEILELENATEFLMQYYGISINLDELHEEHCIELGHIFQLGQKYSQTMNGTFVGRDGKSNYYYMGCYGIGVSRTLAAICEINCDIDGFRWPISIAPYTFYIVSNKHQTNAAEELYQKLLDAKQRVILDDRKNITFGAKLKDAKLFGIPYLVIIGNSYAGNNVYEVEERLTGIKSKIGFEQLCELSTHK